MRTLGRPARTLLKSKNRSSRLRKTFFRFLSIFLISAVLIGIGGFFYLWNIIRGLPTPELIANQRIAQSTKIYDRTGEILLYEIHGEEKRTVIPFEEIPEAVRHATLAIEDIDFYNHPGFDWKSIVRALLADIRQGGAAQGGSTITQQLAKNAFLSSEKTVTRKIKELLLAVLLERHYSKDQILNLYLNQIPYGANAYGIESASQIFFNKSAKNLTLEEAALLASLPKAPSYYSPWGTHVKDLLARKNLVLEKMLKADSINEQEFAAAKKVELKFAQPTTGIRAPHFVTAVQDYLNNQYGEDFVRTAGLKVITTLDWPLEQLGESVVVQGAERNEKLYKGTNAALVAQDPKTGQVLALVGSRDYFDDAHEGKFNVATQGLRQPGSAMKPFAYVTAFQKGYTPDTMTFDLDTEFDATGNPEKSYRPQNFDEKFRGPISFKEALAQSVNVASVKVMYVAGINNVITTATKFGIATLKDRGRYGLSLVLGGGEVKLIDLVGAYSVFAEDGVRHKQSLVLKITDANGQTLEEYHDKTEVVMDPQPVRLINDILSDASLRTPLFANSLNLTVFAGQQVALKTGTTNDYRDAWAMGYTPSLAVGVWAGNNDNQPLQKNGGSILAAVPIWNAFMTKALRNLPTQVFSRPDSIIAQKPALSGNYVVNYKFGNELFPQVHDLLFYVDKNNPQGPEPINPNEDAQFKNWEEPVASWIKTNLPNPEQYNRPFPLGSTAIIEEHHATTSLPANLDITLNQPQNGAFINQPFMLDFAVNSGVDLSGIQVFLNDVLVVNQTTGLGKNFRFQSPLSPTRLELQNSLKIVAEDTDGERLEKNSILYKNPGGN